MFGLVELDKIKLSGALNYWLGLKCTIVLGEIRFKLDLAGILLFSLCKFSNPTSFYLCKKKQKYLSC